MFRNSIFHRIFYRTAIFALLIFSGSVAATIITSDAMSLGGDSYQINYTISNDNLGQPIEEFTIFFDALEYANLMVLGSPAGWDPIVIQPDTNLPDDGFYDALSITGGLSPGGSLSGFTISASFFGLGQVGITEFEIVNPTTFALLESGITIPGSMPIAVPEPPLAALLFIGFVGLFVSHHSVGKVKLDKCTNFISDARMEVAA